jgi:hypothetical protein
MARRNSFATNADVVAHHTQTIKKVRRRTKKSQQEVPDKRFELTACTLTERRSLIAQYTIVVSCSKMPQLHKEFQTSPERK